MSIIAFSVNFSKAALYPIKPGLVKKLCGSNSTNYSKILSCGIVGKAYREPSNKPAPYPYKEKNYSMVRSWFDRTTSRFDENTKVIVVEGPIAAGKTAFAKELAEELGMHHLPEANMDMLYINHYGYDLRQLDGKMPKSLQSFDEKNFCLDPFHENAAAFQVWMYRLRFSRYVDALAHLLSTGDGVVVERSPWSDFVFVDAMVSNKYMSHAAREVYNEVKKNTILQLMRPHIVIYLDVPVKTVQQRIKKRNLPHEVNGKALTPKYLNDIDQIYKRQYLPFADVHSDVLVYDWSTPGDVEAVVEDLERMEFKYTKHDKKNNDWFKGREQDWALARMLYADEKGDLMSKFNVPLYTAPELCASGNDMELWHQVWHSAPGNEYEPGYDPSKESNLFFKTKTLKYLPY